MPGMVGHDSVSRMGGKTNKNVRQNYASGIKVQFVRSKQNRPQWWQFRANANQRFLG